jgi:hypothetical protein
MRGGVVVGLLLVLAACSSQERPAPVPKEDGIPIITQSGRLDAVVGKVVTLVGVQTRTKVPMVLGADVDGDDALSEKRVRVTGRIEKHEQKGPPMVDGMIAAGREGTSYSVIDPKTGHLAKPTPE